MARPLRASLFGAFFALSMLASQSAADAAQVIYCGVVAANSVTSGQGSGPRTFELRVTSGPGGGGRFSVPETLPLPTIGSYICGQFEQGVPMNGLVAYVRQGEFGYVAQPGTATSPPPTTASPVGTPQHTAELRRTDTASVVGDPLPIVLVGLLVVAVVSGLLIARARRTRV